MKKIEMPIENHFEMFNTIANFLESKINLDSDISITVACELLRAINKNANIGVTTTDEDMTFLFKGLAMALIDSLSDGESEI